MPLRLLEAPAEKPVSLEEAKAHLGELTDEFDDLIQGMIDAAAAHLDGATGILGRCLVEQQWALDLDGFSDTIYLPLAPVVSLDAVVYRDATGADQTLDADSYRVVHGRVTANDGWPEVDLTGGAVSLQFTAGYGSAADVPTPIKQAILLLVGHWYANREAVNMGNITSELPMTVRALTTPFIYRVP